MSERKTYEEIMIEISQSGSNKKHCMEYAVDYAEKADNEIATLKAQRDELLALISYNSLQLAYLEQVCEDEGMDILDDVAELRRNNVAAIANGNPEKGKP